MFIQTEAQGTRQTFRICCCPFSAHLYLCSSFDSFELLEYAAVKIGNVSDNACISESKAPKQNSGGQSLISGWALADGNHYAKTMSNDMAMNWLAIQRG